MQRITSFPPVVNAESRILILGSVPGIQSLEKQQYYAHPQNSFWKIIFKIFNEDFTTDYPARIKMLTDNNIALWDVIDSCERKGSLDSDIKNEEANKIEELLTNHPNIKAIFCNGQKSYKNLQRILGKDFHIPVFVMPSTSPAYAALKFEEKLLHWEKIVDFL